MMKANATRKRTKQPPMTREEATSFERMSTGNMHACRTHFASCECDPYQDIYTYRRWQAQGYHVMKGQKGFKIPVVKHIINEENQTEEFRPLFVSAAVFCRCQVEEDGQQ